MRPTEFPEELVETPKTARRNLSAVVGLVQRPVLRAMSATAPILPPAVRQVAQTLAALPGAVAVVLGGSRVLADADGGSDWDLAVYYRGVIELTALAAYGEVHPPGAWGRIMNGGAWLRCGDAEVDVLLRDLDVARQPRERLDPVTRN